MLQPTRWLARLAVAAAALLPLVLSSSRASAAPRELVVGHEILLEANQHLDANMERFVRRVEEVAGFGKGKLRGRAFPRPEDALDYIRKNRVGFAILPAHQLAEARKELRLEVLGRAVGLDGTTLQWSAVTRKPKPFDELIAAPAGLKVAAAEVRDPAWLALLTEGNLDPRVRSFNFLEVASSKAALAALEAKKVDLAILHPRDWNDVKRRTEEGGDLEWIVTSPRLPPSAFVAVGKFVSAADKKKMAAVVDQICKTTGAEACARMGIMYVEAGRAETYNDVIAGYESRVTR